MKFNFNRQHTTIAIYAFLVLAGAILFNGFFQNLDYFRKQVETIFNLLKPFVYGFGIAYILNPVLKKVEGRVLRPAMGKWAGDKAIRGISILVTYLLATGVLTLFFMIVAPQLVSSITGLVYKLSRYINSADVWLPTLLNYFPEFDLPSTISVYLQEYAKTIAEAAYRILTQSFPWLLNLSTRFASVLLSVVVGVIVSIYMLIDKERFCAGLKRGWYALLPKKSADWLLELGSDANKVFGGFISGKLLDSLIIGILCFIGTSLLGMPNVMLVSVIVGVTNVIPYFGPFIGAIPSFFIILIDDPIKALWFLVFIFILQQFDGNILGPKILGDSTGLSAFWVVFAIMLFGGLYGFIGMFLGVPVFSVIYMLFNRFLTSRLKARQMPQEIDSYCASDAPIPKKHKP